MQTDPVDGDGQNSSPRTHLSSRYEDSHSESSTFSSATSDESDEGDGIRGATTLDDGSDQETFTKRFDITVGHVVVEDKDSGTEMVQWKAIVATKDIENVSDTPTAAVMGAIEKATGGVL